MLNSKFFIPLLGFAAPLFAKAAVYSINYKELLSLSCTDIPSCLELLFSSALDIAFPIAVIVILWSGFLFVSAGGKPEKIKTARTMLLWALIGLVIIIGAWALSVAFQESIQQL